MNKLKNFVALYFNLSKKESNGFVILCFLMLAILFGPSLYHFCFTSKQELLASDKQTLDSLVALLEPAKPVYASTYTRKENSTALVTYASFNPNSASEEAMTTAGMPKFISKRIVKFREKGGKFKIKSDLKKMYGLSETDFQKLYAYIELPEALNKEVYPPKDNTPSSTWGQKKNTKSVFDLNTADSLQLIALKGIGPTFASRILKYRKKLGGFIAKAQLKEVYGLDSLALSELTVYTTLDESSIAKLSINSPNTAALSSHPYIGKKIAQLIISYHNQHGNYTALEQLKNIKLISEENYLKMLPYLSL